MSCYVLSLVFALGTHGHLYEGAGHRGPTAGRAEEGGRGGEGGQGGGAGHVGGDLKNKMDLSLQIAVGSSVQIALFVAPLLVFLSYVVAPRPMDLLFSPLEVVAVAISVLVVGQISDDGETHWMEGALLLGVYVILGLAFFNLS